MNIRPLPGTLSRLAEEEINENPQRVASNIQALKDWWSEQPHLRDIKPEDQWLVAILRGSKHNLDKSRKKLEKFYTLKSAVPDFYADRDPVNPKLQELFQLGIFLPVRKCAKEDSPRICIARVGRLCSQHRLTDLIKVGLMISEVLSVEDDNFTVAGEVVIADMQNVGFNLLRQWTPALASKMFMCSERALAVRLKSIHIINAPRTLKAAITLFKMFLKTKLKKRIYVYNQDYEGMYDFIPKSVLPTEYGGYDESIKELTDHWKTKLESYRDWFLQFEKVHDQETNGIEHPHMPNVNNNVNISFRRLELD